MSRSIRISIILGLLFAATAGGTYYWLWLYKGDELEAKRRILLSRQSEYEKLTDLAERYEILTDSLKQAKEEYYGRDKIIPNNEESRLTYEYINNIASQSGGAFEFTFKTEGEEVTPAYRATNYVLTGESPYHSFYNFLWMLENYKRLYAVQTLNMNEIIKTDNPEKMPKSFIRFSIMLTGYSTVESADGTENIVEDKKVQPSESNPFAALLKEQLPPNIDNLPVVSGLKLQAVTDGTAYLLDPDGSLLSMQIGSRVYLGALTRIDREQGEAGFTLNKGGIVEKIILKVDNRQ